MKMNDMIALIANVALTLSLIVAVVFGIAQVRLAKRDRRERLTVETLRYFQTHEFAKTMLRISTTDMPANKKELRALPVDV